MLFQMPRRWLVDQCLEGSGCITDNAASQPLLALTRQEKTCQREQNCRQEGQSFVEEPIS